MSSLGCIGAIGFLYLFWVATSSAIATGVVHAGSLAKYQPNVVSWYIAIPYFLWLAYSLVACVGLTSFFPSKWVNRVQPPLGLFASLFTMQFIGWFCSSFLGNVFAIVYLATVIAIIRKLA